MTRAGLLVTMALLTACGDQRPPTAEGAVVLEWGASSAPKTTKRLRLRNPERDVADFDCDVDQASLRCTLRKNPEHAHVKAQTLGLPPAKDELATFLVTTEKTGQWTVRGSAMSLGSDYLVVRRGGVLTRQLGAPIGPCTQPMGNVPGQYGQLCER